jgi:hypothetical protein
MNESRTRQLSALHRDLDRLTEEAESLAGSVEEEVVGAEILATRDLVANVGIVWETLEQFADIHARQARYLVEDHLQTWHGLLDGSSRETPHDVVGEHVERRVRHLAEGLEQGVQVMAHQTERTFDMLTRIWSPFLAVVRQDWRRGH